VGDRELRSLHTLLRPRHLSICPFAIKLAALGPRGTMRPEMFPAAGVPDPAPRPRPDLDWLKRVDLSETVPPEAISVQGIMASIMRRT
jgi:hypothetical protein